MGINQRQKSTEVFWKDVRWEVILRQWVLTDFM